MSVEYKATLHCDRCDAHPVRLYGDPGEPPPQLRDIRRRAHDEGWRRHNRRDLCPRCAGAVRCSPTIEAHLLAKPVPGEAQPDEAGAEPLAACNGHSEEAVIGELYEPTAAGRLQEEA